MFHHSLVSFYNIALQYCLHVSVPVCVLFVPTVQQALWAQADLLLPFHYRFLGLNAEAKKKKKKKNMTYTNKEGIIFQQCNSVCFVLMYAQIHSVSSFNDDDFTKTVFIIREDKEYLFTGSTVCVCSDTQEGRIMGTRQGREPNRVSLLFVCLQCCNRKDNSIALLWSRP